MKILKNRNRKQRSEWACLVCGPPNDIRERVRDVVLLLPGNVQIQCGRCHEVYPVDVQPDGTYVTRPRTWCFTPIPAEIHAKAFLGNLPPDPQPVLM